MHVGGTVFAKIPKNHTAGHIHMPHANVVQQAGQVSLILARHVHLDAFDNTVPPSDRRDTDRRWHEAS